MTKGVVWRFFLVIGILFLLDMLWAGMRLTIIDVVILAILLALFNSVLVMLLGKSVALQGRTVISWMATIVSLYLGGRLLPHAVIPPSSAFIVGTLLWGIGQLFPALFGA